MVLTIKERFGILRLLPSEGSFVELLASKGIRDSVEITPAEGEDIELEDAGNGRLIWDAERERSLTVDFSEKQIDFLAEKIKAKDEAGTIQASDLDLFIRIQELKKD